MGQDIVADGLNCIMNAKISGKTKVVLKHNSKLLMNVLAIGKLKGYIASYQNTPEGFVVEFGNLHACKAVKPRYVAKVQDIEKYVRRYLPSRNMGIVILSTSSGLMTHQTALEKRIGGGVVAYFY